MYAVYEFSKDEDVRKTICMSIIVAYFVQILVVAIKNQIDIKNKECD